MTDEEERRDERGDESRDFTDRNIPRAKKGSTAAWFGLTAPRASIQEASLKIFKCFRSIILYTIG